MVVLRESIAIVGQEFVFLDARNKQSFTTDAVKNAFAREVRKASTTFTFTTFATTSPRAFAVPATGSTSSPTFSATRPC